MGHLALADIGTPDAIKALVDDFVLAGPMSQNGGAHKKLGARARPYLFPLLEGERHAFETNAIIRDMGADAMDEAANWLLERAEEQANLKSRRLEALRGLAAMSELSPAHFRRLRALHSAPDADLSDQALKTLIALRDSSVAAIVAEKCKPSATALEAVPVPSWSCIARVARFGSNGRAAGSHLMPLLQSPNGVEQATAIAALGYIGYKKAIPAIREALRAGG